IVSADAVLTVLHTNHAPVADGQVVAVPVNGSTPITLTGSDLDHDPITYSISTLPAHATLSGTPPNLTYNAPPNYSGADSLQFIVNDGQVDSSPATVSINVVPEGTRPLIAVNFYAGLSGGLGVTKTGLAASGHSGNDYWNHYSRDASFG